MARKIFLAMGFILLSVSSAGCIATNVSSEPPYRDIVGRQARVKEALELSDGSIGLDLNRPKYTLEQYYPPIPEGCAVVPKDTLVKILAVKVRHPLIGLYTPCAWIELKSPVDGKRIVASFAISDFYGGDSATPATRQLMMRCFYQFFEILEPPDESSKSK